ncbi:MAG TPA: outer membrane beta-barrel protein, partial [Vicinamibacterales bacterium]|nr:outer membrane beta-barrel protein [Vicinamibacterales bacterium]
MPVARGERFECAMWRALGIWGCGVALVVTGAASAAAQQPAPAGSGAGTLSAQAAVALGVPPPAADAQGPDTAADPGEKEKPPEEQAADTGGLIDFFKSTELTGFVDAYYGWNFNGEGPALLRNFDVNHNEFSFALAEVALEKKATADSRVGFRLDFDAGQTADMVNSFEPGGPEFLDNVQQGYASFLAPVGKGLQIDFGKFVTPHGAEVIETRDNWNYSRGLLFALAIPYYHMGVRIGYPVTDTVSVT